MGSSTNCDIPKLAFNNFVFPKLIEDKEDSKKKWNKQTHLDKLLKEQKTLEALKSKGKHEAAESRATSRGFENAFNKLKGVKVKDNVGLTMKSVLRQKQKKQKSKEKWENILEGQEQRKLSRQEKRKANIAAAKNRALEKKINKRNNIKPKKTKKKEDHKGPKKGSFKPKHTKAPVKSRPGKIQGKKK